MSCNVCLVPAVEKCSKCLNVTTESLVHDYVPGSNDLLSGCCSKNLNQSENSELSSPQQESSSSQAFFLERLATADQDSENTTPTDENINYTNHSHNQFRNLTGNTMSIGEVNTFNPGGSNLNFNEIAEQLGLEEMCNTLIRDMNRFGVCVVDNFLGHDKGLTVLNEVTNMYSAGVFQDGQLVANRGRNDDLKHIRSDKIIWIDGKETDCTNMAFLINQVDAVVTLANKIKDNGKLGSYNIRERTKAMVACYPGSGSHYLKHIDNPNQDGRCITAIYYLNLNWDVRNNGGLLRIFPESSNQVADIEPIFDRILFFWSDKRNPHEVQPAHRTRYAITLWYLDADEREIALTRDRTSQETVVG